MLADDSELTITRLINAPPAIVWKAWSTPEHLLALTAIITFKTDGSGTRYSARVMHRNAAASRKHADMGFYDGWGTTTDQLAALIERLGGEAAD